MNWLLILSLSILSLTAIASQPIIKFPKVEMDVAFSKIAALPFRPADNKIAYGEDPLQFALLWRAKKVSKLENKQQNLWLF
ncbi:hypothetical protein [Paraglaciecola sp. MB-3u-78]|uniref:hypothetical protein n=1 Tax=Paraglaciecola sp. MB-3u-78 TaxID=2058332 RepID=UPI0018E3F8A0|nr:hypothetical protein [Paraglaciecola sp. MB-3u-78]